MIYLYISKEKETMNLKVNNIGAQKVMEGENEWINDIIVI